MTQIYSSVQDLKDSALLSFLQKARRVAFVRWLLDKGYAQGVFWALMIAVFSVMNDVIMRFLGDRLPSEEIVFFRFFFSMVTVLPLLSIYGWHSLRTKRPGLHVLRAVLGVGAIVATCYSVNLMQLSENTTIMFAEPLFFLFLAAFFLKEKVDAPRWIATLIGFIGILVIVQPGTDAFRLVALIPIAGAVLFACLDALAKIMIRTESSFALLFYFAVGTTVAGAIPVFYFWETPTLSELAFLLLLGMGANLIQVSLFRAFSATDASALMPFRYAEFPITASVGFLLFYEIPTQWTLIGLCFIVAGTAYISYHETRKEKKKAVNAEARAGTAEASISLQA